MFYTPLTAVGLIGVFECFMLAIKPDTQDFHHFYTLANQILVVEPVNWWFNVICCLSARDKRLNGGELAGKIDGFE